MTIVYKLEITGQFDDDKFEADAAEKAVLDAKQKAAWERKVEKAFARYAPDCSVVCSDIKVFPAAK